MNHSSKSTLFLSSLRFGLSLCIAGILYTTLVLQQRGFALSWHAIQIVCLQSFPLFPCMTALFFFWERTVAAMNLSIRNRLLSLFFLTSLCIPTCGFLLALVESLDFLYRTPFFSSTHPLTWRSIPKWHRAVGSLQLWIPFGIVLPCFACLLYYKRMYKEPAYWGTKRI